MKDDRLISLNTAIDALWHSIEDECGELQSYAEAVISDAEVALKALPPAQQTALTADDIETIRIHLSAFKEKLCNQGRWTEAEEYERLIQRLTGRTVGWIPTSERLPEDDVYVFATTTGNDVTIAERYNGDKWFINEGSTNATTDDITAWMPLPAPYRAEGEENR